MTQRILFVCTGNICRSPAAEVLFQAAVPAAQVASAATGAWHLGEGPTNTNIRAAQRAGFDLSNHRAQQFAAHHFAEFDWLIGMTRKHCEHMETMRPAGNTANVCLFSSFDPDNLPQDFPDPYGQDDRTYDAMWMRLEAAMPALVTAIVGDAASAEKTDGGAARESGNPQSKRSQSERSQ